MADLTITIGPVSSSITASNANAAAVATNYLYATFGADVVDAWTNQEKADNFMTSLREHIVNRANRAKRQKARTEAHDAVVDDDWTGS